MSKDKISKKYNPNITEKEKETLGDKAGNLKTNRSEDDVLKQRKKDVDFTGKDLDVPGRDLPSGNTKKTLKDEENQLYSQGG